MPLRSRTVRISDSAWESFRQEAEAEGISTNQWIVEAAIARLTYSRMKRHASIAADFDAIFAVVRELVK